MGGSKSNTGIRFIDDGVDDFVNNGINAAARNLEQGTSRVLGDTAYAIGTGDFNNFGNTMTEVLAASLTGGASIAGGFKAGTSGRERREDMEKKKAASLAEADAIAAQEAKATELRGSVAALIDQRRSTPGRSQTLLTGGYGSGSLLTRKG